MLPSILAQQVRIGLEDQLRASFSPSTKAFELLVEEFIAEPDALTKGPWLSLDMPFRRSAREGEFFPEIPLGFKPYRHQERAFERLSGPKPQSTLVATGTGSGKTECFLLPMLHSCLKTKGQPGIKAIIIYPMNALATDQARRIAKLVASTPALQGVRVGIYADERPAKPSATMTATGVIDSREALIQNPPDVLLTNYKMLDYMLVRPDEREIWEKNRPETLRYLAVDELHTFDGAQGTDLASLVRRLKARLGMSRGDLCCVGTSATLGGGGDAAVDLVAYASEIFDESFDASSVVTEDRKSVAEYLGDIDVADLDVPLAEPLAALLREADDVAPEALVRFAYGFWFKDNPPADVSDVEWRVGLGARLDGHLFFQSLLKVLRGRPTSYQVIKEELRRNRLYQGCSDQHLDAMVDTITILVAHARRREDGATVALPYFNVRHQLWVRELRRMVASVDARPRLAHNDDLGADEQRRALPVLFCRSCGGAGWATVRSNDHTRPLSAEVGDVYEAYFSYSDRLRFVFREPPVTRMRRRLPDQTVAAWLCTKCLAPHEGESRPEEGCRSCRADPGQLIEVFVHRPGRMVGERFRGDHDCVFCGSPNGLGILGAQSVTLVSGMVGTLFGSHHNDDPKLLTFSDSVQDAAHRAGVLQARNATNVFRAGLSRFVCEAVDARLDEIPAKAPEALRVALGSEASDADFVATYLPSDMEWRNDYARLLDDNALPQESRLPEYLGERLAWDSFAELTFRSRMGATIERTGLVAPHVDIALVEPLLDELQSRMAHELSIVPDAMPNEDLLRFLVGLLDHMRARGAVVNDTTRTYVEREANWYAVTKVRPEGKSLPQYAPGATKPTFPSNRIIQGFEPVATDAVGGWYVPWFQTWFDPVLILTGDRHKEFYQLLFRVLEHRGLVEQIAIGGGHRAASCAWGLKPETIRLFAKTAGVRCDSCGNQHQVPAEYASLWSGMRCTRTGCGGRLSQAADERRNRYRTRILTKGRIKRVIAAEHTSLLGRARRQAVEERFMSEAPRTWYPNLLSATPTLEMGINIGDLSTLILCSVPPEQANYVQRIGRTGRRDGNSLNVTVAVGRPHDMWYWTDPEEMISGKVKTPGVHLKAVAILRRQFAAYTLDCMVKAWSAPPYGQLGAALIAKATKNPGVFPNVWFSYVDQNAGALFEGFCRLFPGLQEDREALEILHGIAHGSLKEGLAHFVSNELTEVENEIAGIGARIKEATKVSDKLKQEQPAPLDLEDRLAALAREKKALSRIRSEIQKTDVLGFLTDRGVLPNYVFPEQGVTLKSVLYPSEGPSDADDGPTITEYVRPSAAALAEFAPRSLFYAESRKVKIDQVDLMSSPITEWRICPDCTHMDISQGVTSDPCPRCGSLMWGDKGSLRAMIKLRQVYAIGTERNSRIGDDGEERERRFFDRDYLPAFERDQIGDAYAVDDGARPFAYEHLRRCTFREVNFGECGDAPNGQKVAGQRRNGHGFTLCRHCGKVQDPDELRYKQRDGSKLGLHAPRCPQAKSESGDTYVSVVYLYREFTSEAIRFLLPLASSAAEDDVKSLRAAIELGLRLHFKGKVDHLRSSLVESKEGPLTRRHLYLYDTVPGGTGYIKQLANRPDDLKDVFSLALTHMRDCACNQDPRKDGCPRCVRSHTSTFGKGDVSRDTAIRIVTEILAGWDKLARINSVDEVKLNAALESELEQMFASRLQAEVLSRGGKMKKDAVGGQPGYFLKIGETAWRIEPQVRLHTRFVDVPKTRADFVLWPAVPSPCVKPVAVYLDGWKWHADRVPEDLSLRQQLIRSGHVSVWSLSWDDVGSPEQGHLWNPLPHPPHQLAMLEGGNKAVNDLQMVLSASPFDQLMALLEAPEPTAWISRARLLALSFFLNGMAAGQDRAGVLKKAAKWARDGGRESLEAVASSVTLAIVEAAGRGMVAVGVAKSWRPPAAPDLDSMVTVVGFEHRTQASADAQKAWNGGLRLLNLLQYGGPLYVGCVGGVDLDPAAPPPKEAGDPNTALWDEVERLAMPEMIEAVRRLRRRSPPMLPPEAVYEVVEPNGAILGTLELAWPDEKKGVVTEAELVDKFPGWDIVMFTGAEDLFDTDPKGEAA